MHTPVRINATERLSSRAGEERIASVTMQPENEPQRQADSDTPPRWARTLFGVLAIAAIFSISLISEHWLTQKPPPVQSNAAPGAAKAFDLCGMEADGYLTGRLFGALEGTIDWRGQSLECDGMERPDGGGIRLVFASQLDSGADRIVFVIGIDGKIDEMMLSEQVANITIIDEVNGRFFSTGGADRCWTTIDAVESLDDLEGSAYQVGGDLYCSGSVPSLSGTGSVSLRGFRYSGRMQFNAS
jgi:hypothetical protein